MTEIAKRNMVEDFIDFYNLFDIDGMISFLHPDIEFINISGEETNVHTYGIDQFKEIANQGKALFSSRRQTIKKIDFIDDNNLIVEIVFEGIPAYDMPNGLKMGEILKLDGKSEYMLKDDLFIKITDIS